MAMQFDVKATAAIGTNAVFTTANGGTMPLKIRVKGFLLTYGTSAITLNITDGSGGPVVLSLPTITAANNGSISVLLPGEGIMVDNAPHAAFSAAPASASIVLFWG